MNIKPYFIIIIIGSIKNNDHMLTKHYYLTLLII